MESFLSFFIIIIIISMINQSLQANFFVITKHNTEVLENWFNTVKKELLFDNKTQAIDKEKLKQSNLCHKFRNSKIFSLANSTDSVSDHVNGHKHYDIPEAKIRAEIDQLVPELITVQTRKNQSTGLHKLPAFKCLDYEGELNWIITKGFHPNSYLIFFLQPRFQFVSGREIGNRQLYPQLVALIDEAAEREPFTYLYFDNENQYNLKLFVKSVEADSGSSDRDKLCELSPLLKYRLCSLGADSIRPGMRRTLRAPDGYPKQGQTYMDPTINYFYPPADHDDDCKIPILKPPLNTTISRKLLYCSVKVTTNIDKSLSLRFYLSLNTLDKGKAFVFWINSETDFAYIHIARIPLLKHLTKYKADMKLIYEHLND